MLLVTVPQDFTTPQSRSPNVPGYVAIAGGTCRATMLGAADRTVAVAVDCRSAASFSFRYGAQGSAVSVPRIAGAYGFETSLLVSDPIARLHLAAPVVTVRPGRAASLRLDVPGGGVESARPFSVTLTARDAFGNVADSYSGRVSFTTSDPSSSVRLPGDFTFATGPSGDRGAHTFNGVVLVTPPSRVLTVRDTADLGLRTTVTVAIVDRTPPELHLPSTLPTEAGPSGSASVPYTATADDVVDGITPIVCVPPSGSTFPVGTTTVVCSAADLAGNTATGSFQVVVLPPKPPTITFSGVVDGLVSNAVPLRPAFAVVGDDVASVAASLDGVDFDSGSVVSAEGAHVLVVRASDLAGNSTTASVHFTIDTTPPAVVVDSPADGARIAALTTDVAGTVTDATPLSVTVAGVPILPAADGSFRATVPLEPGANAIPVVATDEAGNSTTITRNVQANATPPTLSIGAPADGFSTSASSVHVTGTAQPADATDSVTVAVNGHATPIAADGSFFADVPLVTGTNTITIVATDGYGLTASTNRTVTRAE